MIKSRESITEIVNCASVTELPALKGRLVRGISEAAKGSTERMVFVLALNDVNSRLRMGV